MTEIDPKDVAISVWPPYNPNEGFSIPKLSSGVQIEHVSGIVITCTSERSQHMNRHKALVGLRAMLEEGKE